MPKQYKQSKFPPGTFRSTELHNCLQDIHDGYEPPHPHWNMTSSAGHTPRHNPYHNYGDHHSRPHNHNYGGHNSHPQYFGACPKTFHQGTQSRNHSTQSQSYGTQPRSISNPRPIANLSQVNITSQTLIVSNHPKAAQDVSSHASSDQNTPLTSLQHLPGDNLPQTFKDVGVQTDIYYMHKRTNQEIITHLALMDYLNIVQKDSSTQTCGDLIDDSPALLDFYFISTPMEPDAFSPLSPPLSRHSVLETPTYSQEIATLDNSGFDSAFFLNVSKLSYDLDLETLAKDVLLPEDSSDSIPAPNLLLEETKSLFSSLSLSGPQYDLLMFDETPSVTPHIVPNTLNFTSLPAGPVMITDAEMENDTDDVFADLDEAFVEELDESL